VAQSVELLLDAAADAVVRDQWTRLASVGLPSEDRSTRPAANRHHHSPHVTLFAADRIEPAAEAALPGLVAGVELELVIGSVVVFGPRRGRCILVRLVVASRALLELQQGVAEVCCADPAGQFGAGRWVPHVTLAHRVPTEDVGSCLTVVGDAELPARADRVRRWDGTAKEAWLL
jgi:hypothetical protein